MKKLIGSIVALSGLILGASICLAKVNQDGYQTTDLQVGFPLTVATPNGSVRVLIPTATDAAALALGSPSGAWNGGAPVVGGLTTSLSSDEVEVICPANSSETQGLFDFGDRVGEKLGSIFYDQQNQQELTLAQAQAELAADRNVIRYLGFVCHYQGSGAVGGHFSLQEPDRNIQITNLINPLIPLGQETVTLNQAVILPAKVQLLNSSGTILTSREVLLSTFTQAVRASANIDEQIMFRLEGIAAGQSACNDHITTSIASTPLSINYQTLTWEQFIDAASGLVVDSSAQGGYTVTLAQDHLLRRTGGNCPTDPRDCLPNFGSDNSGSPLSATAAQAWTDPAKIGLGYTVVLKQATPPSDPQVRSMFNAGTRYSRFANLAEAEEPVTIISSEEVARRDTFEVCYRLVGDYNARPGSYTNGLIYTLTATF